MNHVQSFTLPDDNTRRIWIFNYIAILSNNYNYSYTILWAKSNKKRTLKELSARKTSFLISQPSPWRDAKRSSSALLSSLPLQQLSVPLLDCTSTTSQTRPTFKPLCLQPLTELSTPQRPSFTLKTTSTVTTQIKHSQ